MYQIDTIKTSPVKHDNNMKMTISTITKLLSIADQLDTKGLREEASLLDKLIAEQVATMTGETEPVEFEELSDAEKKKVKNVLHVEETDSIE